MRFRLPVLIALLVTFLSVALSAQQIRGDYIETRSADVYTGQCFANGEVNLAGNEVTFYPPLTEVSHSMPAVAVTDAYRGPGLGESWDSHGRRSAFVGTFAR